MIKFYRVAVQEIGGFVRQLMWDGIDCHRARMLGWIAESVHLEPIRFVHLRPQGASHKGIWTGRFRVAFGQYFMGTSPLYYLAVVIYRLPSYPVLIGSVAMRWGYLTSWLKGLPRYDDHELRRFPARLLADGQAGRHGPAQRRAGPPLACQPPGSRVPDEAHQKDRAAGPLSTLRHRADGDCAGPGCMLRQIAVGLLPAGP
jgi:hypothetical protein